MVDGVIFNERTGHLLDGHMRVEEFIERNETEIPVILVDLPEEKEHLALYFKDRIGEMNGVEPNLERQLANLVETESELLAGILEGLDEEVQGDSELKGEPEDFYGIGLTPGEKFNYVMLLFRTDLDWYAAQDHFGLERVIDPLHPSGAGRKVGIGRVIDGGKYLSKIRMEKLLG
jgi:hypothetical protein